MGHGSRVFPTAPTIEAEAEVAVVLVEPADSIFVEL